MTVSEISKCSNEKNPRVISRREDCQNGSGPVNPLESEGNIYQHAAQSIEGNENCLLAEFGTDLGADDLDVCE